MKFGILVFIPKLLLREGTTSTWMRNRLISKRGLSFPGCKIMMEIEIPPSNDSTYLQREGSGGDYLDSDLSTRAIAVTVIQCTLVLGLRPSRAEVPNLWYAYPWGYAEDQLGYTNSKSAMTDTRKLKGLKML
ncbi:hypothetical protein AVEN_48901-1 [Araneus ventricosus]|uniref:Uncharacterized protein n=1 Tax=Araneus ventricosus TaxID=182803 RepID=A0A4Y2AI04_ARAVE|nr:hypothetical protein AVEN_48901-1 [Araneus ventricosus]